LVVVSRWDEKAGLRTGCGVRSQVIDVLKAQIKRRPAMKKISTAAAKQSRNFSQQNLTIGLDLGDRSRADARDSGRNAGATLQGARRYGTQL
jgi:hypothetical protein